MSSSESVSRINVVALSTDNASAVELLRKCFTGLTCSSDCTNCTFSMDGVNLGLYTKYPGDDVLKAFPEFLDFVLVSVPEGHQNEEEILNYAGTKADAKSVYLVDGGDRTLPSKVQSANVETIISSIKEYNFQLLQFLVDSKGADESKAYIRRKRLGCDNELREDRGLAWFNFKLLPKLQGMMKSFENFDSNRGYSENNVKFDFSPTNDESNGVGLKLNIFAGNSFDENNTNLPLTVRDNPLTGAIELQAKSPEQANDLLALLKNAKDMLENMGLIEMLNQQMKFDLSFSKDGASVFVDFVIGGNLGEAIIHRIRSLNLSKFNYSFTDSIRVQTNLNISEVWKNPDLDNIINKLSTFTVQGDAKLLNFRTIFHFIKEAVVYAKDDQKKKNVHLLSSGLLILSCFESLGLELKYDSKDLKGNVMELLDDYLEGEGSSQAFIGMGNDQWVNGLLPMGLQMIQSIAPMFTSLGDFSSINFDKISFELLAPGARLEVKLDLLLPGLTEFVAENVLGNQ